MGYGIRKTRSRKIRALPSAPNTLSKSIDARSQSRLADSVHFRAPEKWRGKINSKRVRGWFKQFLNGQALLSSIDPGPGMLELSVRISRGALNKASERLKMPGVVLLRRLIAAQIEPAEVTRTRGAVPCLPGLSGAPRIQSPRVLPVVRSNLLAAGASSSLATKKLIRGAARAQGDRRRLRIVSTVESYRSLGEIGQAMRTGQGITDEELIRWRAAHGHE